MQGRAEELTRVESPFDELIGLRFEELTGERVVATLDVRPELHQRAGLVHGGVYAGAVETVASVGAALWLGEGRIPLGVSNHTDFLRAVRSGWLRFEALPLHRGRTMQLWQVEVSDEDGRPVAHGKVRLFNHGRETPPRDDPAVGNPGDGPLPPSP